MIRILFLALICTRALLGDVAGCAPPDCNQAELENVNSRYTVEGFDFTGTARYKDVFARLSGELQDDLKKLIGQKFNQRIVDKLSQRIREEIHAMEVSSHVTKGSQADFIRVVFETKRRRLDEDATITKLGYNSKQGWTGGIEFGFDAAGNQLVFGVQSDGDTLIEREAGINARISHALNDRVVIRFAFETVHEQWNQATLNALPLQNTVPGVYRTRQSYSPSISFVLTPGLTWSAGLSFQNFQNQPLQYPSMAAQTESANAVVNTLRYHRFWQSSDASRQEVEAGYTLRAATSLLGSDLAYVRHSVEANYARTLGEHQELVVKFLAGRMSGRAPLFERYSLGNSTNLRGFNKYDIDPLGGSHLAYGSVNYRYRVLGVFYDTGAVWDKKEDRQARQAAGVSVSMGSALRGGILLSVAFPLQYGRSTPMFMMTANF